MLKPYAVMVIYAPEGGYILSLRARERLGERCGAILKSKEGRVGFRKNPILLHTTQNPHNTLSYKHLYECNISLNTTRTLHSNHTFHANSSRYPTLSYDGTTVPFLGQYSAIAMHKPLRRNPSPDSSIN